MADLELVSTDDLLDELIARMGHCVFAGLQAGTHGGDNHTYWGRWDGNSHTCVGLAMDLNQSILDELRSRKSEEDPDG